MTIVDLLRELQIQIAPENHHHATLGWAQIDCPYCSPGSNRYRMGIPITRPRVTSCWTCGTHSLIETLSTLTDLPKQKCRVLLDQLDVGLVVKEESPRGLLRLPMNLDKLNDSHRRYLQGRGYDVDRLEALYGIKGLGLDGAKPNNAPLRWRIFIPIKYHGKTVSWTTRSISDCVSSRYISAEKIDEAIPHKQLLYAQDYVRHAIIICEGPLDAWKIGPGAVATFGTSFTKAQILKMIKYPVRVVCFDTEKTAQKGADRLCMLLRGFPGITHRVELDSKDPGCAQEEEIRELRKRFLDEQ